MTGLAALFALKARGDQLIHNGQPCIFCSLGDGELIYLGYDHEVGEMWGHPVCKEQAIEKIEKYKRDKAAKNADEANQIWQR